jgi:hypothetical protein
LVTPKAGAKHEVLFNKPASEWRGVLFEHLSSTTVMTKFVTPHLKLGFVDNLSLTKVSQQSVTKICLAFGNLITLKARDEHELLFNKSASKTGVLSFEVYIK